MAGRQLSGGTLRGLLNRLRWDAASREGDVILTMRVRRSGEETREEVAFTAVAEILPAGVNLADGTFLPYHRIVAVRRAGEVLWLSRRT